MQKYLVTLRSTFDADNDIEADIIAALVAENAGKDLDDEDTVDVTQCIPLTISAPIALDELANEMRAVAKKLVTTKIKQCWDLGRWLWETAWILEHRTEESFDHAGYDPGEFMREAEKILDNMKAKG